MKREYQTLVIDASSEWLEPRFDGQSLTDRLNTLGKDGWELVAVMATSRGVRGTRDGVLILKRPIG